jgi:hypothetical protein
MMENRQLVALLSISLVASLSGCIFSASPGERDLETSSDTDVEHVDAVDAADTGTEEDVVEDVAAEDTGRDADAESPDAADVAPDVREDSGSEDAGEPDTTDTADTSENECGPNSREEGCPCTYSAGEEQGVCQGATYDEEGNCQKPADYYEDEDGRENEDTHCDGKDNDCDGAVDEGCSCEFRREGGVCDKGARIFDNGKDGECLPIKEYEPQGEDTCGDNLDNDCDGDTDCQDDDCTGKVCDRGGVLDSCCPANSGRCGGARHC